MFKTVEKPIINRKKTSFNTPAATEESSCNLSAAADFADRSIRYHKESPMPVVQMIRKRVKGRDDTFTATDIYYDKTDGQYYTGVTKESSGEVTVPREEYQEYNRLLSHDSGSPNIPPRERMAKNTILAKAKRGETIKYVTNIVEKDEAADLIGATEETAEEETAEEEIEAADIAASADIFSEGNAMTVPPKTVRLYAEGNMKHAASLAGAFGQSGKYGLFEGLDAETTLADASADTPEALIKATEFDSLDGLGSRYEQEEQEGEVISKMMEMITPLENLEASFGGRTGNMTRRVEAAADRPKRQYDIIQATFFWVPDDTNDQNFENLQAFMINQAEKLKEGGKIRVILTDKNTKIAGKENLNHYRDVANRLAEDPDLKHIYDIDKKVFKKRNMRRKKVRQTYANKLTTLEMNAAGFKHTRTEGDTLVKSFGDLIITAVRKPHQ